MEDTLNCYKILDLEPGATVAQVRKAYIELAQVWQPERYVSNPALQARAQAKREEIETAYQALRAFLPDLPEERTGEVKPKSIPIAGSAIVDNSSHPLRTIILWMLLLTLIAIAVTGYKLSERARLFAG